jgi:hypothetical protein
MPPAEAFAWAGPGVGIYQGYYLDLSGGQPGIAASFLQLGYYLQPGRVVLGLEAEVGMAFVPGPVALVANLNGRFGLALGNRLLLYTEAGVGRWFPNGGVGAGILNGGNIYNAGAGAELGLGSNISVFLEAKGVGMFGAAISHLAVQGGFYWRP